MVKYILQSAGEINWMALFALITFFALFLIGSWTVIGRNKEFVKKMASLPLEEEHSLNQETPKQA